MLLLLSWKMMLQLMLMIIFLVVGCCLCLILKFMQEIIAELQVEVLCLFWALYFHMQNVCASTEHIFSTYIYKCICICICMLYVQYNHYSDVASAIRSPRNHTPIVRSDNWCLCAYCSALFSGISYPPKVQHTKQ